MPNIIIEDGAWGSFYLEDIRAVAQSVCDIFLTDAAIDVADSIIVRFSKLHGPMVLLERGPNNEHIILVSANDRRWSQLAYQFAHEYCHVFSAHYREPLHHPFGWL
jgi:DNA-binding LacI/PurR family transcriptional regulator